MRVAPDATARANQRSALRNPTYSLARLFLRSRKAAPALLALLLVALLSRMGTGWLIAGTSYSVGNRALVPMLLLGALAAACVIGSSAHSPFGELERTSARSLPLMRLAHLCGLLLCAAPALAAVLLTFDLTGAHPADPLPALLRNLVGLTGLALLTARVLGAHLSWTLPLAFAAAVQLAGRGPDDRPYPWAWPLQSGADALSWAIALTLLAAGLALICLSGSRETAEDQ